MTLPTTRTFPMPVDYKSEEDLNRYLTDFANEVTSMYEDVVENINGNIRSNAETDQTNWTPTLAGTGGGGFTYTSQYGWSKRQGIFNEIFFDITWSATTAAGTLYVELPYIVLQSSGMPFLGPIASSGVAYGVGATVLSIMAIPNTYRGEIWQSGSGIAMSNLSVPASGRIIGSILYIGKSDE